MNEVTHGRHVRGYCFPICDMVEIVVIFECVELGEEELVVSGGAVLCGEVWSWCA